MKITLIYIVGSALEPCSYYNVIKFKLIRKHTLKIWYKYKGKMLVVKEDLRTVGSFTVKGW